MTFQWASLWGILFCCCLFCCFVVAAFYVSPVMGKLIKSTSCNELCPNWHLPTLWQLCRRRLLWTRSASITTGFPLSLPLSLSLFGTAVALPFLANSQSACHHISCHIAPRQQQQQHQRTRAVFYFVAFSFSFSFPFAIRIRHLPFALICWICCCCCSAVARAALFNFSFHYCVPKSWQSLPQPARGVVQQQQPLRARSNCRHGTLEITFGHVFYTIWPLVCMCVFCFLPELCVRRSGTRTSKTDWVKERQREREARGRQRTSWTQIKSFSSSYSTTMRRSWMWQQSS